MRSRQSGPWSDVVTCDLMADAIPAGAFEGVEAIFHLAGVAATRAADPANHYRVNVQGTRRLVAQGAASGVGRFVCFSSVRAMAPPPKGRCVDESWEPWPTDPYGRSKREAEEVVLRTAAHTGIHAVVLRPALVYGPGVKGNLARLVGLVDSGLCPPLPNTHNRRSMVHVEDLCEVALRAALAAKASGKRYIVTDGRHYSTRALYEGICQSLGRKARKGGGVPMWRLAGKVGDLAGALLRRPLPVNSQMISSLLDSAGYSSSLVQDELDWRPQHDLMSSLPDMVAGWHGNRHGQGL